MSGQERFVVEREERPPAWAIVDNDDTVDLGFGEVGRYVTARFYETYLFAEQDARERCAAMNAREEGRS